MTKRLTPPRRPRRPQRITLAKKTRQNAQASAVAPETKTRIEEEEILKRIIRKTPAVLRYPRGLRSLSMVGSYSVDVVCVITAFKA